LAAKQKINRVSAGQQVAGVPRRISADGPGTVQALSAELISFGFGWKRRRGAVLLVSGRK